MNVYTDVAYRRQGIAFTMTNMLIEAAWSRGATEISLDATESGRALYRKCGFKDSDECMVLVLSNMTKKGELQRISKGKYRLNPESSKW